MTHDPSLGETKDYTGIPPSGSGTPKETSTPRAETPIQGDTVEGNDTQHSGSDPLRTIDFAGESDMPMSFPDIPGYEIEKELGRGGMGVVYKAKQKGLDRTVALKMILKADFATSEQKLRFQIEAENAARVQHPNIVQVFEIGEHHGQPYFAQEFIDGGSLADWLKKGRMSTAEAAAFIETLARAMHTAHAQGIIHRDLKPANVLLTSPGRESGEFTPKITDFGLAKRLDQTEHLTGSHAVMGTPTYMSPEQAQGKTKFVGPAADQYALGVIFYQLLTGKVPFEADTIPNLLIKITTDEPASPRNINPSIPHDLQVICLKCLEKDATKRYLTAEALAEDLRNWREHRPITARPATRLERVTKWCRRYPAIAALIVVSTLAAVIASGLAWWAVAAERQAEANERQALRERDLKEKQRQRAEANEKLAEDRLVQVEEEKQIATAVSDFLQYKLLGQLDPKQQANLLLALGRREEERDPDPKLSVLLSRAAAELAPDKIEANFPKQPLLQAALLQTVGNTYTAIGGKDNDQYALAISFLERAAKLRKQHLGADHPSTLTTLNNLAAVYQAAGRLPEAIRLFEQVRDAFDQKLGADHPDTLGTLHNLAVAYRDAGRLPEAIRLFEQVRDAFDQKLGADHPDTLSTLNNLAYAYQAAGRLPEAIRLYEQVRAAVVQPLGADHPYTLRTLNNLALAYLAAGRLPAAIRLFEQVRDARVAKLGADHPDTLTTLHNLAGAYQAAGRLAETNRLYEQVRDARVAKLGADHPSTLTTLHNLAGAYRAAGRLPEAIRLLEQVRAAQVPKLGADHPDTLSTLANLAVAYQAAGRLPEAIRLYEQVRDARVHKLGADHPDTLGTLGNLAGAYYQAGRLPEAIRLYEQVRDARVTKLGADHPDTLTTMHNLAVAYQAAGRLPEALPFFEQAASGITKRLFQHQHAHLIIPNTIRAYEVSKQFEKAEEWRRKWLAHVKASAGVESPAYAGELAALGLLLMKQEKWGEAQSTLSECLAIREKIQPDAWTTFNTQSMLGGALLGSARSANDGSEKAKMLAEAEPLLLKGCEGIKDRLISEGQNAEVLKAQKQRLSETCDRLIELYTALEKSDGVKKWQAEKEKWK